MISFLSHTTTLLYQRAIKPILFRSTPDAVHSRLIRLSALRQKFPLSDSLVSLMWAYHNQAALGQKIDGVYFPNPVGLSAGFDKSIELLPTIKAVGFGYETGGSVTFLPCEGNPRPWFYRLPTSKSLVVNVGLANDGTTTALQRIKRYRQKVLTDFPLVMSVAKTNNPQNCSDSEAIEDYLGSLQQLKDEPRVTIVEINISCPNAYGGEPFTDPPRLAALMKAIDGLKIAKPIWVKMPINLAWPEFDALLKIITAHNVQGVTIGNLSKDRRSETVSVELPNEVKGNLSGLPTQKLSDDLIEKTYREYGDRLTIIGVGGIFTAEDAYRKICLGANLVGLITGMIFEGPQLVGQVNRKLVELLKRDNFSTIGEAVGSAHRTPQV
ncbi:quinone-dependent dihydroorotate dehydrogenase [Candidatus Saccharibacteria bacterium]|nr:MAG: quinone-dependent dihydroorotate dehydrogenase [Candidatus Saccharibacteria bacterium]